MLQKQTNKYEEPLRHGPIVGLQARGRMCGTWLISRRIAWSPVANDALDAAQAEDSGAAQELRTHAALPRAWTGFNNCTARTTGGLTRQFFGRGRHHIEDCYPTDVVAQFKKLQQQKAWQ